MKRLRTTSTTALTLGWCITIVLCGFLLIGSYSQPETRDHGQHTQEPILANRRSGIYHWTGCPQYPTKNTLPHWESYPTKEAAEHAQYRPARNCTKKYR